MVCISGGKGSEDVEDIKGTQGQKRASGNERQSVQASENDGKNECSKTRQEESS